MDEMRTTVLLKKGRSNPLEFLLSHSTSLHFIYLSLPLFSLPLFFFFTFLQSLHFSPLFNIFSHCLTSFSKVYFGFGLTLLPTLFFLISSSFSQEDCSPLKDISSLPLRIKVLYLNPQRTSSLAKRTVGLGET